MRRGNNSMAASHLIYGYERRQNINFTKQDPKSSIFEYLYTKNIRIDTCISIHYICMYAGMSTTNWYFHQIIVYLIKQKQQLQFLDISTLPCLSIMSDVKDVLGFIPGILSSDESTVGCDI